MVGLELHLHARATREVDVEESLAPLPGGRQARQDEEHRADDRRLHPLDELKVGLAEDPGHRERRDPAVSLGEIEHHPRAEHGREQVEEQAEEQRDGKALELVGADRKQHDRRDQRGQVGVDDRRQRPLKAVADRHPHGGAAVDLLPHPLVDEHVGINGHAHREHEAGETGEGEGGFERDHHRHHEQDVEQHREVGDQPGEPVVGQHEGQNQKCRHEHRQPGRLDRVVAEL